MTVNTHTTNSAAIRIVGFEVEAFSVNWGDAPCKNLTKSIAQPQVYKEDELISYTY